MATLNILTIAKSNKTYNPTSKSRSPHLNTCDRGHAALSVVLLHISACQGASISEAYHTCPHPFKKVTSSSLQLMRSSSDPLPFPSYLFFSIARFPNLRLSSIGFVGRALCTLATCRRHVLFLMRGCRCDLCCV